MEWRNVPVPAPLYERIKSLIIERKDLGYHAISTFVAEAVRRRLEEIENGGV